MVSSRQKRINAAKAKETESTIIVADQKDNIKDTEVLDIKIERFSSAKEVEEFLYQDKVNIEDMKDILSFIGSKNHVGPINQIDFLVRKGFIHAEIGRGIYFSFVISSREYLERYGIGIVESELASAKEFFDKKIKFHNHLMEQREVLMGLRPQKEGIPSLEDYGGATRGNDTFEGVKSTKSVSEIRNERMARKGVHLIDISKIGVSQDEDDNNE